MKTQSCRPSSGTRTPILTSGFTILPAATMAPGFCRLRMAMWRSGNGSILAPESLSSISAFMACRPRAIAIFPGLMRDVHRCNSLNDGDVAHVGYGIDEIFDVRDAPISPCDKSHQTRKIVQPIIVHAGDAFQWNAAIQNRRCALEGCSNQDRI